MSEQGIKPWKLFLSLPPLLTLDAEKTWTLGSSGDKYLVSSLYFPTEIYISDAFFLPVYYTQALEEGVELAVAFERKKSYLEHKNLLYSI